MASDFPIMAAYYPIVVGGGIAVMIPFIIILWRGYRRVDPLFMYVMYQRRIGAPSWCPELIFRIAARVDLQVADISYLQELLSRT